jgi:hypothetical protein
MRIFATCNIAGASFVSNAATHSGGAIILEYAATLAVKYSNFTGNSADRVCIIAPIANV